MEEKIYYVRQKFSLCKEMKNVGNLTKISTSKDKINGKLIFSHFKLHGKMTFKEKLVTMYIVFIVHAKLNI